MHTALSRTLCQRLATEHQHGQAERARCNAERTAGKVHSLFKCGFTPRASVPAGVWDADEDTSGFFLSAALPKQRGQPVAKNSL